RRHALEHSEHDVRRQPFQFAGFVAGIAPGEQVDLPKVRGDKFEEIAVLDQLDNVEAVTLKMTFVEVPVESGRVMVRREMRHAEEWRGGDETPAGFEHAFHLAKARNRIADVLEALAAQDRVKRAVAYRNVDDITDDVDVGRVPGARLQAR